MSIFGKKKENKPPTCACGGADCRQGENIATDEPIESGSTITSIKVLGMGCKSCEIQFENVKKAVASLNIQIEPEHITDPAEVMKYGAMAMPAIVINEKLVSSGKVLKPADVEKLLAKH